MSGIRTNGRAPSILVCNDDGIDAPGLQALVTRLRGLGNVTVVAPKEETSAVGHAITIHDPVRVSKWQLPTPNEDIVAWAVGGTPVDCLKLSINQLLPQRPDLVVSGINRGSNTAANVVYSGTVGAATEACMMGIQSVAFSLCTWTGRDFTASCHYADRIVRKILRNRLPTGVVLNVNVPAIPLADIKGVRVTRLALSRWEEEFVRRADPSEQPYFWYSGEFVNLDEGLDTDVAAVEGGYVSLTPLHFDRTAHQHLASVSALFA